jgi:hypothetical protein
MTIPTTVINPIPAPTGGIVALSIASADPGPWELTRSISTDGTLSNTTTLYSGDAMLTTLASPWTYLDCGDGTNLPLVQGTEYVWSLETSVGTVSTLPIASPTSITLEFDNYTQLLVTALQAALPNLSPADGLVLSRPIKPQSIIVSMPLTGVPTLPFVTINPDLIQQEEVPIGHGIDTDTTLNQYNIYELVNNRYTIAVFTNTQTERDYYRIAILSVLKSLAPIMSAIGQDVTIKWQVASSQKTASNMAPGFYFSEIAYSFKGLFSVKVTTNYGIIDSIDSLVVDGAINDGAGYMITDSEGYPITLE